MHEYAELMYIWKSQALSAPSYPLPQEVPKLCRRRRRRGCFSDQVIKPDMDRPEAAPEGGGVPSQNESLSVVITIKCFAPIVYPCKQQMH